MLVYLQMAAITRSEVKVRNQELPSVSLAGMAGPQVLGLPCAASPDKENKGRTLCSCASSFCDNTNPPAARRLARGLRSQNQS